MAHQRGLLAGGHADPSAMPSTRASNYVSKPLSKLPIRREIYTDICERAIRLANEVEEKEICSENMPPSLAAGVIAYIIKHMPKGDYQEDISFERIASVCDVSEGTLQKCLKRLESAATQGLLESVK